MNFVASNEKKLERALEALKKAGNVNPSDEQVREQYIKFGGRIVGDRSTERGTDETALIHAIEPETVEAEADAVEEEVAEPVRRVRRKA